VRSFDIAFSAPPSVEPEHSPRRHRALLGERTVLRQQQELQGRVWGVEAQRVRGYGCGAKRSLSQLCTSNAPTSLTVSRLRELRHGNRRDLDGVCAQGQGTL